MFFPSEPHSKDLIVAFLPAAPSPSPSPSRIHPLLSGKGYCTCRCQHCGGHGRRRRSRCCLTIVAERLSSEHSCALNFQWWWLAAVRHVGSGELFLRLGSRNGNWEWIFRGRDFAEGMDRNFTSILSMDLRNEC